MSDYATIQRIAYDAKPKFRIECNHVDSCPQFPSFPKAEQAARRRAMRTGHPVRIVRNEGPSLDGAKWERGSIAAVVRHDAYDRLWTDLDTVGCLFA